MTDAKGAGPWFAALLVRESSCQSRVIGHTYPHLALDEQWTMATKVGPFDVWADCVAFVDQWSQQGSSIKRGRELYDYYGRMHRLHCWTTASANLLEKEQQQHNVGELKAACIKPKKKYK